MRVLATFASAFALGIFLAQYLLPQSVWMPGCLAGLTVAAALRFFLKGERRLRLGLLCAGLSLSLGYNALYVRTVQQPMLSLANTEQTITMTLCEYPEKTDWGAKVTVRLPGFSQGKAVYYGDASLLDLAPGQTVTDMVSFRDASRIRDDDVTAFTSKGVFLLAYSRGEAVCGNGSMDSPRWWPARMGKAMRTVIARELEGDTAGFLMAILTGDTAALSEEGKAALSESGLYHILAVSGMHCGYLLAIATLLIGRHRQRLLAAVTMTVLVFYVFLTGGSPSVLRACVMLSFVLVAPIFRRESDGPTSLSAALMLILLANPYSAASISLQLSFAAIAGMLWLPKRLYRLFIPEGERRGRAVYFAVSSVSSTMGALVFTVPISAWYFGDLVLISPLSNLLCLWAAGLAFFTGLLSVMAGMIFLPLGKVIAIVPGFLINYILGTAKVLSHIPYHSLSFANPYLKYWIIYVYILFALAWAFGPKRRRKYALASILAVLTLIVSVKAGQLQYRSGLDVIVLDVGQGQCVVLKSGEEFALVDCGSSWQDAGDIAAQQLRSMGCDKLDYLLLTHYDIDHVSGVAGILARMETETLLLLPPDADDSGLQTAILSAAEDRSIDTLTIRRRHNITFGETTLTIYPPLGEKTDNERGLSLLAMSGTDSILITGDMSQKTEELLLDTYRIPEADVLVVGHHGAKNSTSTALLEALTPEIACISVGSNSYGHPAEETLQRLAHAGCAVYRTDLQGDIHLSLNPSY